MQEPESHCKIDVFLGSTVVISCCQSKGVQGCCFVHVISCSSGSAGGANLFPSWYFMPPVCGAGSGFEAVVPELCESQKI